MISQEKIKEVIDRIVKNINPEKIILFGSYASGNPGEDSDLDILIVKEMRMPRYKRSRGVKKHLRGMKIPIDIIVYTKKEIKEWEGTKTAFINQAISKESYYMDRRNELIKEWIHKADHDLGMAKLALEHKIEYTEKEAREAYSIAMQIREYILKRTGCSELNQLI